MIQTKKIDPRVIRTRKLLLDSFKALKEERGSIRSISVLDITVRAGVNRATFYSHFRDKYEMMSADVRDHFQAYLKDRLPIEPTLNHDTIHILIITTLDVIEIHTQHIKQINKQYEPLVHSIMQQELQDMLTIMLNNSLPNDQKKDNEYISTFLSWAIFGSANNWSHSKIRTKEAVANDLFSLVVNSLNITLPLQNTAKSKK